MDHDTLYRSAVEWIAYNDEPMILDLRQIAELISVSLVSDVFGVEPVNVAKQIILIRRKFK